MGDRLCSLILSRMRWDLLLLLAIKRPQNPRLNNKHNKIRCLAFADSEITGRLQIKWWRPLKKKLIFCCVYLQISHPTKIAESTIRYRRQLVPFKIAVEIKFGVLYASKIKLSPGCCLIYKTMHVVPLEYLNWLNVLHYHHHHCYFTKITVTQSP